MISFTFLVNIVPDGMVRPCIDVMCHCCHDTAIQKGSRSSATDVLFTQHAQTQQSDVYEPKTGSCSQNIDTFSEHDFHFSLNSQHNIKTM